jgi:transposase
MEIIKQVVAIDVAAEELVCAFGSVRSDLQSSIKPTIAFPNSEKGFKSLENWANGLINSEYCIEFIFEATGIYHQKLAYWLYNNSYNVVVLFPNKIANYTKTLNQKTITDSSSASVICRFGLAHKLDYWHPPLPIFRKMKQLTRERSQIVDELTVAKNQLHAELKEQDPYKPTIRRLNSRIKLLEKHEQAIENEIKMLINSNNEVKERIARVLTIPGVGMTTAAVIFAETNGFDMIRNKKQLTSYAGLDVAQKQSGTSVNRKTKISKKGNKYLRKILHFPALTSVTHNKVHKEIKDRIVSKTGLKMKGYVCIQRRILELAYILDKTKTDFDKEYEIKKKTLQEAESSQSSLS